MPQTPSMRPPDLGKAIRNLLSRYNVNNSTVKKDSQFQSIPNPAKRENTAPPITNPIQTLVKRVTHTLSQLTQKPVKEDYQAIVNGFLPEGARLLTPRYPGNASEIYQADLDQDSQNELLATFRHDHGIRTIILKKQEGHWYKVDEIHHGTGERLNYRGFTDVIGEGRDQLLIGLASQGSPNTLHGYILHPNKAVKIFDRHYDRLDVLAPSTGVNRGNKAQLAVWNKNDDASYHIDLLHWNSQQLESVKNRVSYYNAKVVPYHMQKLRQAPTAAMHWYNLAEALAKSGSDRDAAYVIQIGMKLDTKGQYTDRFAELKKELIT